MVDAVNGYVAIFNKLFLIIDLNLAMLGHPIICCDFLAIFAPSVSLLLK